MLIFHGLAAAMILAVLSISTVGSACAEPVIRMAGDGWKERKTFDGAEFACDADACGGPAVVRYVSSKVLANTEEELNKPYANIRAIINGSVLNTFNGQDGGIKFNVIRKRATKDYTAVDLEAHMDQVVIASVVIIQGGRSWLIVSGAETVKLARANLAKAMKSADFRRLNS